MKASEFEDKVWEVEGIRLVLRCADNQEIGDYGYTNAISQTTSVTDWLKGRVIPYLNGIACEVIAGNGEQPHGRSLVRTIRSSYAKD